MCKAAAGHEGRPLPLGHPTRRACMARALLVPLVPLATWATRAHAQQSGAVPAQRRPPSALAFELISPAEAQRDREARPKNEATEAPEARTRGLPGVASPARSAVAIRIVTPAPQTAVAAPLRIELAFEAPPGTRVVPSTFRILYGVLKIDLTERLRRFATINEHGVVVEQAVVPDGLHRLLLQVADDKGQVAEQEMRLRVGVVS